MTIKMIHPDHGATHAYTGNEVADLESKGWTVAPPKAMPSSVPDVAPAAHTPQKKKPGRPPKAK